MTACFIQRYADELLRLPVQVGVGIFETGGESS